MSNIKNSGKSFPIRMLGPVRNVVARANGRYRYRLLLKCKNTAAFRKILEETVKKAMLSRRTRSVSIFVDMNGETI